MCTRLAASIMHTINHAGSDMDFAVTGWVLPEAPSVAPGAPPPPAPQPFPLHEWEAELQREVLDDLADALESQRLVRGTVRMTGAVAAGMCVQYYHCCCCSGGCCCHFRQRQWQRQQ